MNANTTITPGIAGGIASATINGERLGTVTAPTVDTLTYFRDITGSESHINSIIPADPGNIHASSTTGEYSLTVLGDANLNDGERVFADSITWVIKPDANPDGSAGAFTGSENFIFSFDGGLGALGADLIPEPSATALLGIGALGLLTRRKRA